MCLAPQPGLDGHLVDLRVASLSSVGPSITRHRGGIAMPEFDLASLRANWLACARSWRRIADSYWRRVAKAIEVGACLGKRVRRRG